MLALSQLSRAVEQRHDKRPILSDLRESGSLEQDADLVFFIYRDEYYDAESDQQGLAEVHLAKHRNGPTGTAKLSFLKRFAKFADLARDLTAITEQSHTKQGGKEEQRTETQIIWLRDTATSFSAQCEQCH